MASIPQNYLFNLRFPIKKAAPKLLKAKLAAETLDDSYSLPFWSQYDLPDGFDKRTGEPGLLKSINLENEKRFDFRFAWAKEGFFFTVVLAKKKRQPFWTHSALQAADCVRLCIDTRDIKDVHRGTKFCHKLLFYPFVGESANAAGPMAQWAPVNRAKASPNSVDVSEFSLCSQLRDDGYAFSAFIPGATLTGYDYDEFNRIGLHYIVRDSTHGAFVLQYADPAPCEEDPGLWASFALEN
ncbi:MAG: hypothetical protein PHO46_02525 [Thermoguttaceae bacterium]|mgnify:CR=1 FL=1|jgi:hypothetical protein|nr:hypothetical protein [Thermoguttaceae bacterium]